MPLIPASAILRKLIPALLLTVLGLAVFQGEASAHPLGNFTINHYTRLEAASDHIDVTYIVDMAEIPTHAERATMDVDGDGALSPTELDQYRAAMSTQLVRHLTITGNGQRLPLQLTQSVLSFPAGQAALPTLRMELHLVANLPAARAAEINYADGNFADRIGWREIVALAQPGAELTAATVSAEDVSHALTAYPQDLLSTPLQETTASFTVAPAPGSVSSLSTPAGATATTVVATDGRPQDPFAQLIAIPVLGADAILLALLAAMGWGAVHALSPGHGKTIVAAYLVGSRGTARHALFLGLTTTLTHTAGVFAVGLVALTLTRFILPEQLYPWLSTISGLLVVVIGASLVRQRLRHGDHAHRHQPGAAHAHAGLWHVHSDPETAGHTHTPTQPTEQRLTWRSLLALGISGGLLPCPSALVLMLGSISLHRIGFGLLLILAFSIGLAGVLTLVGILLVHAGKLFERFPEGNRVAQFAPVASAIFIVGAGLVITAQALAQTGLLPI